VSAAREAPAVDPRRVVVELRELHELTGDDRGAQRLAWTDTWVAAREWMAERLAELPVDVSTDAARNRWATLGGERDDAVLVGSHIDSVPDGGWLDGALELLAGLEVLPALARRGTPPVTVRLVDWADEEGARFGYGCLGSSAAARTVDPADLEDLTDRGGQRLPDVLAAHGVYAARMLTASAELAGAAAYVELHIEHRELPGQTAHAGSTPMDARRDALAAAARLVLAVREPAREADAVATVGRCAVEPGIVTAVPGRCEVTLDQRHLDAGVLRSLLDGARRAADEIARVEGVHVEWSRLWGIEPVPFDAEMIDLAEAAVHDVAGSCHRLPSGPLHDAAEVARAGVPTVMLFVQSLRGLSHTSEEDTRPEHLETAVHALAGTVQRMIERASGG
jgi:acetylornithine deacetylase/succinyl-diaminopimelate desuccinylase-like protein